MRAGRPSYKEQVHRHLQEHRNAVSAEEIAAATGVPKSSVYPAVRALFEAGEINKHYKGALRVQYQIA